MATKDEEVVDDLILIEFGICASLLLYGIRYYLMAFKKMSNSNTCCLMSLLHHAIVSIASFSVNISFLGLLTKGITFQTDQCEPLYFATNSLAYTGTFSVAYLLFDTIFDLMPKWSENKLMIFHHINGIVLISISVNTMYAQFMVVTAHLMEVSSVFLNMKSVLKEFDFSDGMKDINDKLFALSFLVVRNYTSWACLAIVISLARNSCFNHFTFIDFLMIYTTVFFLALNTFWSYGIVMKVMSILYPTNGATSGSAYKVVEDMSAEDTMTCDQEFEKL
jgi:hypothetical protein